jgi:hypothetical protein
METDSFEADLRQALARHAAEVPVEAVERLQRRNYRPRTRGQAIRTAGLAGMAGAAAVAVVAGVALSQPAISRSASPASGVRQTKLAAWTVTSKDGTVTVKLRQLADVAALQAKLHAAGIPASVSTAANVTPGCAVYPANLVPKQAALGINGVGRIVPVGQVEIDLGVTQLVFRSSALPRGAGVQIVQNAHGNVFVRLVRIGPRCIGS